MYQDGMLPMRQLIKILCKYSITRFHLIVFMPLIRVNWEESNLNINAPNTTDTNLNDTIVNSSDEINSIVSERQMYMTTYAVIMAVGVTVYLYRSFAFFKLCLRVSINLHNQLFRGITRAKMLFYNTNPSGRILNRFARDINNVDSLLPIVLIDCIDVSYG